MKAREISQMTISYFENGETYNSQGTEITIKDYLINKSIENKDKVLMLRSLTTEEEQKTMKKYLPSAKISMIAGEDKSIANAKRFNNLLVLDFDTHDNMKFESEDVLLNTGYRLFNLPFVYMVSRSCRGKGLFCIIPVKDIKKIKDYIKSLYNYFKEEMNLIIDIQCSNLNRGRFISYDELVINREWIKSDDEDIEVYDVEVSENIATNYFNPVKSHSKVFKANDLVLDNIFIMKAVMRLVKDCNYKTNDYYSWLMDGFRLATLGEDMGFFLFLMISRNSSGYKNDRDVQIKFRQCLSATKFDRSCMSYYFGLLKSKYGDKWRSEVESFELPLKNQR